MKRADLINLSQIDAVDNLVITLNNRFVTSRVFGVCFIVETENLVSNESLQ